MNADRQRPATALLLLAAVLSPSPAEAARARTANAVQAVETAEPPAAAAPPAPERAGGGGPSTILIVPRIGPAERAARERAERERRAAVGPHLAAWCGRYRAALRPLTAAIDEALRSLRFAAGPYPRHVAYPVAVAAAALGATHLPAPDPDLDRQLRTALLHLEGGAAACQQGMQTTAQLWLGSGRAWLAAAERTLALYAAEGWACGAGGEKAGAR